MRISLHRPIITCIFSSLSSPRPFSAAPKTLTPQNPNPNKTRTQTPLEKQFESWINNLKPGFTPDNVTEALISQPDPDLALDIFRWTGQQRNYKHSHVSYLAMINIAVSAKRYRVAETLVEEVLAGACPASLPLYNSMIKFCIGRKFLFNRAFDVYKKMTKCENVNPNLETYNMLLDALLRKFNKLHVCYVYLHSVKSLAKQMKSFGVIPDTFTLNMIIKAYSKCHEVDEAVRVFREMGLYGCEPNAYSYGYIVNGLCEKERVNQGFGFFKEMREKGFVPKGSTFMILVCSLAMECRFEDAVEVVFDMLDNSLSPDQLTYKTVLEELCREGRGSYAFELLEEFKKRDSSMNEKNYKTLLNGLYFLNRD